MSNNAPEGNSRGNPRWRVNVIKAQNKVEGEGTAEAYTTMLAEVLRTRDVFRFRHFLAASGQGLPGEMLLDTHKIEALMHQLTLNLPALADLHEASRDWLDRNTALQDQSLNEAAKRAPGELPADQPIPPVLPGRRSIALRPIPRSRN